MKAKLMTGILVLSAMLFGQRVISQHTNLGYSDELAANTTTTLINYHVQAPPDMDNGKGYFYTSFKPDGFKEEVNVGDDLFVRMNLGKTMIELSQENGINADFYAYGFVTVYIDDQKCFMSDPLSFASNYSKKWLFIDIPLNISPDFITKIASDQSMLETDQDIWVFQQLFQENSINNNYTKAAITKMQSGTHTLKVEFGLGESSSSEPMATVCTGTVKIICDAAGAEALANKGPKNMRPLSEEEKGKFNFSSAPYNVGSGALTATLDLPQPPKYYNMKWCKATTCDYDHGDIEFYASIDNIPIAAWSSQLWENDYDGVKSFPLVILPANDAGLGNFEADFNNSVLFKHENPIVYALYDMLYGGKLEVGKHTLKIKAYSIECVPLNTSYEFIDSYFAQWPSIAETSIDFNVTESGLNSLINNSTAKKLSHAGGEWTSVDNTLKSSNTGVEIIDVAAQTQWKIVQNSLGAILYRTCKADVLYKCDYGYRIQKSTLVKEDYSGGGTYGSPYFAERIEFSFGPSLLNSMHVPVPISKVK